MPNMTERVLWQRIRVNVEGPHWTRIETGAHAAGVPDLNGCANGRDVWVELKIFQGKKRTVRLTPRQVIWHEQHTLRGGLTYILVASQTSDLLVLWAGSEVRNIRDHGFVAGKKTWVWNGKWTPMTWVGLRIALFQPERRQ